MLLIQCHCIWLRPQIDVNCIDVVEWKWKKSRNKFVKNQNALRQTCWRGWLRIKEASDTCPPFRKAEDQRSTQSRRLLPGKVVSTQTQACPKGDDITLVNSQHSGLVLQSQVPDLSAHQELIHFFQGHIQRYQTLRDCKTGETVH